MRHYLFLSNFQQADGFTMDKKLLVDMEWSTKAYAFLFYEKINEGGIKTTKYYLLTLLCSWLMNQSEVT